MVRIPARNPVESAASGDRHDPTDPRRRRRGGVRRLFVSDLHLTEADHPHFRTLGRLLGATAAEEVYLLGDLCEVWVGDDDDGPLARALVGLLTRAACRARVFVMPGNRDFLYGERFAREAGVELIGDPHCLPDGILLAHGDAFCTDDHDYQALRRVVRSAPWQEEILSRSLAERRALALGLRAQSRASNANKASNIMDVSAAEVDRVMTEAGMHILVHGHTHRPGIHPARWGKRLVLGAWERCAWYLEQDGNGFTLTCSALDG